MNGWITFALILVFVGNIGGLLIIILQSKSSDEAKDQIISVNSKNQRILENELNDIKTERVTLRNELEVRDKENNELTQKIIELNRELFEKSDELNKFMGMSGNYPFVLVSSGASAKGIPGFTFTIANESDYPLYDVVVVVMDFNKILQSSKKEGSRFVIEREKFKDSIILMKDENHLAENSNIITSELFHYTQGILYLKVKSRSSFVTQRIAFVTEEKKIYQGFQVRDTENNILKEWLGKNTPKAVEEKLRKEFEKIPDKVEMTFVN